MSSSTSSAAGIPLGAFGRRPRLGLTVIEVLVTLAILLLISAVAIPSLSGVLGVQQRAAARELAQTYTWLIDEAALRNVCFRVTLNLDRGTWLVEVGDPDTLVFATPEEREEYEAELEDKMARFTQREIEEGEVDDEITEASGAFEGLDDPAFTSGQQLPPSTRFEWVYTPQYGDAGVVPNEEIPEEDEGEDAIAYTYIFPNGTAEHTVIRIVDWDDPEEGYTIEVEPLTGRVQLSTEIRSPSDSLSWLPDEGPRL